MTKRDYLESFTGDSKRSPVPCFRCGVCCVRYQVLVTEKEAQEIVGRLGLAWNEWLETYVNPRWPGTDNFILSQVNGACIFLEQVDGSAVMSCTIEPFKPLSCREWAPGMERRECQEGLARWGLTVSPSGQIEGTPEKLDGFRSFLESMVDENTGHRSIP